MAIISTDTYNLRAVIHAFGDLELSLEVEPFLCEVSTPCGSWSSSSSEELHDRRGTA